MRQNQTFLMAGSRHPEELPAVIKLAHVPTRHRPSFYNSARLCLDPPRTAHAHLPYAPSEHLFEAAACGVPVITSAWSALSELYQPGTEVLTACDARDVVEAMSLSDRELEQIGEAARERTLAQHSITALDHPRSHPLPSVRGASRLVPRVDRR